MKRINFFALIIAIFVLIAVSDGYTVTLGGKKLVKNGTGLRTKLGFVKIYYATLYVPVKLKGKKSKEIIEANEPMIVTMYITTGLLTAEKFMEATKKGFVKAERAGYKSPAKNKFLDIFKKEKSIEKKDVVTLSYVPGKGVIVKLKKSKTKKVITMGVVGKLKLKQSLWAIWIGPDPVQESLKKSMLGN